MVLVVVGESATRLLGTMGVGAVRTQSLRSLQLAGVRTVGVPPRGRSHLVSGAAAEAVTPAAEGVMAATKLSSNWGEGAGKVVRVAGACGS